MDLSIIIVNYNVNDWLLKSIKSVYDFIRNIEFEIIVVDNNSSDNSISNLKASFPNVITIQNKFNAGFAEANNQGIRIAKAHLIMLLNPDTEIFDSSINELLSKTSDIATNDLYAPCLLNSDRTVQNSTWHTPDIYSIIKEAFFLNYFFNKKYNINSSSDMFEVQNVSGALMLFRKELIKEIGFLDKELFWMEDTDFCFRIRKIGGHIYYLPKIKIFHHCGKSAAKNQKIVISNQIISKIKFFRKHYSYFSFFLSLLFSFIQIISRILIFALFLYLPGFWIKEKAYCYSFFKLIKYILVSDKSIS